MSDVIARAKGETPPVVLARGRQAFLEGWPHHDRRLHEREAHWYSDRW